MTAESERFQGTAATAPQSAQTPVNRGDDSHPTTPSSAKANCPDHGNSMKTEGFTNSWRRA